MNKWLNEMFEGMDKPKSWPIIYMKHIKLLQLNMDKHLSGINF